jgi:hypothetical protein
MSMASPMSFSWDFPHNPPLLVPLTSDPTATVERRGGGLTIVAGFVVVASTCTLNSQ